MNTPEQATPETINTAGKQVLPGWHLRMVEGGDIHIVHDDGRWCGYSEKSESPAHRLTYAYLTALYESRFRNAVRAAMEALPTAIIVGSKATVPFTPQQKLKYAILQKAGDWQGNPVPGFDTLTGDDIDVMYDDLVSQDGHWDARNEVRESGMVSNLPSHAHYRIERHYEHHQVAAQMADGSWVGWTYFHGGGKHGEPQGIPWMEDAYDLTHQASERMTVVHSFQRVEQ